MNLFLRKNLFKILPYFFPRKKYKKVLNSRIGITTLLCHNDVGMFLYCLNSFFIHLRCGLPVFIVDDGTLTSNDEAMLKDHFMATIIKKKECDKRMKVLLKPYKNFYAFRFGKSAQILKYKFDVNVFHPFDKWIYLDADILFYKKPAEILNWLNPENKSVLYSIIDDALYSEEELEMDSSVEHCLRRLMKIHTGASIETSFFSSLLCFPEKKAMNLKVLEETFELFNKISYFHSWLSEQTAFSFLFSTLKRGKLPFKRYINIWLLSQYNRLDLNSAVSIHYAGGIKKDRFIIDAVKLAIKSKFF